MSSTDASLPRFDGRPLAVVRNRRQRRLRLSVDLATGVVRLSLPARQPLRPALAWAESRRDWVEARLAARPEPIAIVPGLRLEVAGRPLVVDWAPGRPRRIVEADGALVVGGPIEMVAGRVLRHLRAEALAMLDRETRALAGAHGLTVARVTVGDARRRWGSCGVDGHVRYNWRLILAPDFVRQSVVAHEVAHLREHHHGPSFHAFAAELLGDDHRAANVWLREHGAWLHRIGAA